MHRTTFRQVAAWMTGALMLALLTWVAPTHADEAKRKEDPSAPTLPRVTELLNADKPIHMVQWGDSISEVGRSPRWHGGASRPENNWGSVLRDQLAEAYPDNGFKLTHAGIGGQNTYEGLGRLNNLWRLEPDVVLIAFGANDCWWHELQPYQTRRALSEMIETIRKRGIDVVVVSTAGNAPADDRFMHVDETIAAQRQAAAEHSVPFANTREPIMRATDAGQQWGDYHLGKTNCHPNDKGQAIWAQATSDAMQQALERQR